MLKTIMLILFGEHVIILHFLPFHRSTFTFCQRIAY